MHRIANRLSAEPNSEGANVAQEEEDEVHYEIVMTTFRGISMKIAANRSSVMLLGQYKAHCDEFRVPMQLNRSERKVIRGLNSKNRGIVTAVITIPFLDFDLWLFFFFLNQSILFIVSAMSTTGKRSNTISTSLCNAIATYS